MTVTAVMQIICDACQRQFQVPTEWSGRTCRCKCGSRIVIPGQESGKSAKKRPQPTEMPAASIQSKPDSSHDSMATGDKLGSGKVNLHEDRMFRREPAVTAAIDRSKGKTTSSVVEGSKRRPGREELLGAIPLSIIPVRTSPGYLTALALCAGIMLLLPLLYIGLIGLTAYGVYWHFAYSDWLESLLGKARGKAKLFVVLLYAAPGVVGGILALFMLKPFFRRSPRYTTPDSVSREQEPVLFEYVDRLCDVMRAPRPVRIDLDQSVNASASFASSRSLFTNQLVLTIGLPVVEGLTLTEFTSVMAHEFGHFSQFWAMRFYYVIETINHWFRRVVVERDALDLMLSTVSKNLPSQFVWVLYLARLAVWCVRKILTGFRHMGVFFSRRLSRHMEFDADQFAVRLAGVTSTVSAFERIGLLSLAESLADRSSTQFLREGKALDNFSRFVIHQADTLPPEQAVVLIEALHRQSADWTSTHPSTAERIERLQVSGGAAHRKAGIQAAFLFGDFRNVCRELTRKSYRSSSGEEPDINALTSVDELIAEDRERRRTFEVARKLVLNADVFLAQWGTPKESWDTDRSVDQLENEIRVLCEQQKHGLKTYLAQSAEWRTLSIFMNDWMVTRVEMIVRGRIRRDAFPGCGTSFKTLEALDEFKEIQEQKKSALEDRMVIYEVTCATRFLRGLQLAVRFGANGQRLSAMWVASLYMGAVYSLVVLLECRLHQMEWLFDWLSEKPDDETASLVLEEIRSAFLDEFQNIYQSLGAWNDPFSLPDEDLSISASLLPHFTQTPDNRSALSDPGLLYYDVSRFCSNYRALRHRVTGELATAIEATSV